MKPTSISHAEHYVWGDACDGWHLLKRDDLSVIQERIPAGAGEVMHYHTSSRQFFYILEGAASLRIEDRAFQLQTGDSLEVPPRVPHQIRNDSIRDLAILVISMPPSHGDRVNVETA